MARKVNLNSGDFKRFKRNQDTLGTQTPLSSTAVERGTTRWLDGSVVSVEGILRVAGTLGITGTLNGEGTNNLSGVNNFSGANHLTGPTDVAGNLELIAGGQFKAGQSVILPDGSASFGLFDIAANGDLASKGALSIEGPTDLKNDLTVEQGRRITLGGLVLENQAPGSAFVQMPGGGIGADNILGMSIVHNAIEIAAQGDATISGGRINLNGLTDTSVAQANVHIDSNGRLWRVVA